ncbi:hypothetical protein D3C72_984460 [compost metagenome]
MFQFLDANILPDNMLIAIASDDALNLGILSSRFHVVWALAAGGRLGVGNDPRYNKSRCFEPFPFPETNADQGKRIADLAERLDAHRKAVLSQYPEVTLTGMYNLLEKLRAGAPLTEKEQVVHQKSQTSVLRHLHDELDQAVADAYGWAVDLDDDAILEKLVQLNTERMLEERQGVIRWLRPDYQNASMGTGSVNTSDTGDAELEAVVPATDSRPWPSKPGYQLAAIRNVVQDSSSVWTVSMVAKQFKGASEEIVRLHLETWEDLGLLIRYEEDGQEHWHLA